MLDRTQAPGFQSIKKVSVAQAHSRTLANGVQLHWLDAGQQPAIRLEYLFKAGTWHEPQRGIAHFTAKMLNEGTRRRSAAEINEYIDQFGSFMELSHGAERITLTVYTITKHLPRLLPLLEELLTEPVFPERELGNLKKITGQNLQVNSQKTAFLAQNRFRELIFGENHPYARHVRMPDIALVHREALAAYFQSNVLHQPFNAVLAGQITDETLQLVERHLAGFVVSKDTIPDTEIKVQGNGPASETIEKTDSLQSSIRFGKLLLQPDGQPVTRRSADYFALSTLNEILGGYFGSRLMKNIREDKGFTYGIHSSLGTFRHEGFWVVGTDVKKEFTGQTLDEIRKEIRILQTEPVPPDELETVKSYLLGSFAGSVTTPFSLADHFKTIHFDGLDYGFYDRYVENVLQTTPETLLRLAQTYLDVEQMTEVVAGGRQ